MFIEYEYRQIEVPQEIIEFCDYFTYDATREDLRFFDCLHMNLGHYGNNIEDLKEMRRRVMPVFD